MKNLLFHWDDLQKRLSHHPENYMLWQNNLTKIILEITIFVGFFFGGGIIYKYLSRSSFIYFFEIKFLVKLHKAAFEVKMC